VGQFCIAIFNSHTIVYYTTEVNSVDISNPTYKI